MHTENRRVQNLLFSLLITMLGILSSSVGTVADRVALSFGQTAGLAGLYISAYAGGSCASSLIGGALADWLGKLRVVRFAVGLMVLGLTTVALSGSQVVLVLGLFLTGLGFGPSESIGSAHLTDLNPECASRWMNISQIGFGLGAIGAPVAVMAYLTGTAGTYRQVFGLCGVLFFLMFVALCVTGRNLPAPKRANLGDLNLFSVLKSRTMLLCALMVFFYMGYESIGPAYLKQYFMALGESESFGAGMISLFWASMIVCRLIGVFLSGKEKISIKLFTSLILVAVAVLLFAPGRCKVLGVVLFGFGCGPVWPMLFVLASRAFPQRSGAACGIMMLFCTTGNVLFPTVIGAWPGNLRVTFTLGAFMAVLVLACAFYSDRIDARQKIAA